MRFSQRRGRGHGFHGGSALALLPGQYQLKVTIAPPTTLRAPARKHRTPAVTTSHGELK